jgi:hypothetical protein
MRVNMSNNVADTDADGTHFLQKTNPPANWDFRRGLRDARQWNSNGAV